MYKKVNAREVIVGYYSTGPKIKENDIKIDELVRGFCSTRARRTPHTHLARSLSRERQNPPFSPLGQKQPRARRRGERALVSLSLESCRVRPQTTRSSSSSTCGRRTRLSRRRPTCRSTRSRCAPRRCNRKCQNGISNGPSTDSDGRSRPTPRAASARRSSAPSSTSPP